MKKLLINTVLLIALSLTACTSIRPPITKPERPEVIQTLLVKTKKINRLSVDDFKVSPYDVRIMLEYIERLEALAR